MATTGTAPASGSVGSGAAGAYDLSQPGAWARAVLDGIGAPSDPSTPQGRLNITFLESWRHTEGTAAAYNPLATTLVVGGSSDFNSVGVQSYASPADGITATVKTLLAGYPHVIGMLRAGDPGQVSSNAGVWADLNRWSSGRSTPTDSSYVQTISRIFFGEKGAADWTSFDLKDAGKAAANATGVTALSGIAQSLSTFVGDLFNPNLWRRVGLAVVGVALMLIGALILARGAGSQVLSSSASALAGAVRG